MGSFCTTDGSVTLAASALLVCRTEIRVNDRVAAVTTASKVTILVFMCNDNCLLENLDIQY